MPDSTPDIHAIRRRIGKAPAFGENMMRHLRTEALKQAARQEEERRKKALDVLLEKHEEAKAEGRGLCSVVLAYRIVDAVAQGEGLKPEELFGAGRAASVVAARERALEAILEHCPSLSLNRIGALLDRDHTTILYWARRIAARTGKTIRGWSPEKARERLLTHRGSPAREGSRS